MEALELTKKIRAKYASCRSYKDSGVIFNPAKENSETRFSTAFIRPQHFRLEWREANPHFGDKTSVIWSNPTGAFGLYAYNEGEVEREKSLEAMVSAVAGTSSRLAPIIHQLLFGTNEEWLPWLNAETILEPETSGMESYHLISHPDENGEVSEAWIDTRSYRLIQLTQHFVMTAEFQKFVELFLMAKDPELYEQTRHVIDPNPEEERYSHITRYEEVHFDEELDEATFDCH